MIHLSLILIIINQMKCMSNCSKINYIKYIDIQILTNLNLYLKKQTKKIFKKIEIKFYQVQFIIKNFI